METIEEKAVKTYHDNLLYLQGSNPTLFQKLDALDIAINNGYYEEKYALEYLKDSYFDVLEVASGKWLYGENSNNYATLAKKSIDYKKEDNLFETFYDVVFDDNYAKELHSKDFITYSYASAASLIHYSNKHANKHNTTMKKHYKYIFFGVGLGLHISTMHEELQSNIYLIIEDDLELFRLSLFVTDYKALTENGSILIFSVFEDEVEFANTLKIFYSEHFIYNHYIKFFHMLSHKDTKIKQIQNFISGQIHLTFNYAALLISLLRPLEHLQNSYKLVNILAFTENTLFQEKPVLLCAAGPSLDKSLDWLKENHQKFIVVIVSALMSKFEEIGIKPNIVTHVHGFKDAMPHVENVKDMHFFDETISLFGGMSYPPFVDFFKKDNVYIFEGSSRYKDGYGGLTSSNIGSIAYGLMLMFSTKEMYTLGLDFAPDQETGNTHSVSHAHTRKLELSQHRELGEGVRYRDETVSIPGNHQEEVITSLLLEGMKLECESVSSGYKTENTTIYNLSNGAYIENTISLKLDDKRLEALKPLSKKDIYKELKTIFDERSENFLTKKELEDIQQRVDYAQSIIDILQEHLEKAQPDLNTYHYNLLGTFYEILTDTNTSMESSDMNYIITLYLQFVSGFIFDLINTKEIESEKKLIKQLDKVIIPQMIKIVSFFKERLEEVETYIEIRE